MKSIWTDTGHLPYFPPLRGKTKADILVIGGGMAGLLIAWLLKQEGFDCVVAEANTIASGTTANTTAKITAQHGLLYHRLLESLGLDQAKLYLQANLQGLEQLRRLADNIDCDFQNQPHTIYSVEDSAILERELSALKQLGYPAELVTDLPLPIETAGGIRFPHQAQFHPLKFLDAIAQDLTVYENTRIRSLSGLTALADHGSISAGQIVIATHFPFPRTAGGYFAKLYQQRSYAIALENAPRVDGMYLGTPPDGLSFRMAGDRLILGGGGHRTGKDGGGWQVLEDFARVHYPDARITHRWAAQDCMSLDQIPYIGPFRSRTPGIYVATGFNKWGMTTSMAAAMLLRDQILGKPSPYSELFSPARSVLHPQLWVNLGEAVGNYLSLSPRRCPHLGCALQWNAQERSWDCACHGSRFDSQGKLLDTPAQKSREPDSGHP